jgi:flavin-binding protein dodecin
MARTFEVIERVGVSMESFSDAVKVVVAEAHSEKAVAWFNVLEERGRVTAEGKPEFQVTVKLGRKIS